MARAETPNTSVATPASLMLASEARWNKTALQQPMLQQLRDPLGILDVGLAPWKRFDMLSVNHQQFHLPFQNVVDRLPEHPGALHGYMRAPRRHQPVRQPQQLLCEGGKASYFLMQFAVGVDSPQTRHDKSLVNVDPTAALIKNVHLWPPLRQVIPT